MQSPMPLVVILATGGTIAGTASASTDTTGYRAGALGAAALIAAVPALAERRLEAESVAAIDSKDMDAATWQRLAARVRTTWRAPRSPASSSPTAPTRWRRPRTSCTACWRLKRRWC